MTPSSVSGTISCMDEVATPLGEYPGAEFVTKTAPIRKIGFSNVVARNVRDDAMSFSIRETMLGHLEYKLELALVAGDKQIISSTSAVVAPKVDSRWDIFKLWLHEDLAAGWFIRRFWLPKLETEVYSDTNEEEVYIRFCPHFDISRSYEHIQWLGYE